MRLRVKNNSPSGGHHKNADQQIYQHRLKVLHADQLRILVCTRQADCMNLRGWELLLLVLEGMLGL